RVEHALDERRVHRGERRRQRLLDGEIEHALLPGRELDSALTKPADGLRYGQRAVARSPRSVAMDADCGDEADALVVAAPHLRSEHPGRDHADVARGIEAVERQRVPTRDDREPAV